MTTEKMKMVWLCPDGKAPRFRAQMASLPSSRPHRIPTASCWSRSSGTTISSPDISPTATVVSI